MLTSLDLFLISLAILILVLGLSKRVKEIRSGRFEQCSGNWIFLFKYLLGQNKILNNPFPGILHLAVFWGFLFPLIVILFAQTFFVLPHFLSNLISLMLDLAGVMVFIAAFVFLIRRLYSNDTLGPANSIFPVFILLVILITGFMAEGFRLSITGSENIWVSPIGWIISQSLPASPVLMQLMIRIHFLFLLLLVAITPFTFFVHLLIAPVNVFYKRRSKAGEFRDMPAAGGPPGANHVRDLTWKQILDSEACVSCGRCEENCPAFISGKPLSPRKVIRQIHELTHNPGLKTSFDSYLSPDEIWSCTTCMACVETCPVFAAPLDKIVDIRRHLVMGRGELPSEAVTVIRNLEIYGDVYGKGLSHREGWALNREVKVVKPDERDVEIVIWAGCSGSFHPRFQEVSRALVSILKKSGVKFRILGKNEMCCGDPVRRLGEEELFQSLARKNLRTLRGHHVKKIITLCPHCFNTLRNEYPKIENGDNNEFKVYNAAEYVLKLINKKIIKPEFSLVKSITIQDPCYLGRGNNIYEPLRDLIKGVPGVEIKELKRSREKGFCCGAGGGGMWLHETIGKRINIIRSEEIAAENVDAVCTACPYCHTMINDGLNGLELDEPPEVLDIIEVVAASLR